ncbi:hypothetical protein [Paraburkholderia flava]|uniref:hypothetical protein n=1 Tax=Paraburkholderia flava TaxID=2547393 RepID=UPI00105EE582|nr:hypothetical protein [Paraburkholderia flava]
MKTRTFILAGIAAAIALTAGCAAVYRNGNACEQTMRDALAAESSEPLKVSHTGVAIYGSRVVVEGTIQRAASAVPAASAPSAASAAGDATDDEAGSEAAVAAAASSASAPRAASAASVASAASAASTAAAKRKKAKPIMDPAAAECTYDRNGLTAFRWLAPADLVKTTAHTDSTD